MSVAVVLPTYNEAENLPELTHRLFSLGMPDLRVIMVDDNSPDKTGELAEELSSKYGGRIEVVHRPAKQGLGTAYIEGFTRAIASGADQVIQMDADLSHDPEYIPALLEELKHADVVVGSRYVKGGGASKEWSLSRRLLSYMGNQYLRLVSGLRERDVTSGFKAFNKDALAALDLSEFKCKGFAFQTEVAVACRMRRLRVTEHPITFSERAAGRSKISWAIMIEALWRLLPSRLKGEL